MLVSDVPVEQYFVWLSARPTPEGAACAYVVANEKVYVLGSAMWYPLSRLEDSRSELYFTAASLRRAGFTEFSTLTELHQALMNTPIGQGWSSLLTTLNAYLKESTYVSHR